MIIITNNLATKIVFNENQKEYETRARAIPHNFFNMLKWISQNGK